MGSEIEQKRGGGETEEGGKAERSVEAKESKDDEEDG